MGEQVAARLNGGVAQLGEHLPCKQGVKGSNPSISIACLVHADSMRTSEAQLPRSWHYMPMHLNLQPLRNASIPHGSKSKRARIFMYLENCIQKIQNIFNTKDTRHPRKKPKMFVNTNEPKTNVHNAI